MSYNHLPHTYELLAPVSDRVSEALQSHLGKVTIKTLETYGEHIDVYNGAYNLDYLDRISIPDLEATIPILTFAAASRFFKQERTYHSYQQLYSTWGGLSRHVDDHHDPNPKEFRHKQPIKCECPIDTEIALPLPPIQWPTGKAFFPDAIEAALPTVHANQARFFNMRITPMRKEVLEELIAGIRS